MKDYPVDKLRNVCLMGHGRAGKTTLAEALLFNAGAIDRFGSVPDGTTTMDYDQEEISRQFSINTSIAPVEWKDCKINIIDTPGYFDFVGDALSGLRVTESVIIVISARSGISVGTEKAWAYAKEKNLPIMIFVNKLDDERANYQETVTSLKNKFGTSIAPFLVPIKEGDKVAGFVDVAHMVARKYDGKQMVDIPIPSGMDDEILPIREMIMEAVAETSEELMDKFFAGEEFTDSEIQEALRNGMENCSIVPVLCGSASANDGIRLLADAIVEYCPAPNEAKPEIAEDVKTGDKIEVKSDPAGPLAALVFKTVADPYVGKLSMFKVYSGKITADSVVYNPNTDTNEKIGHLFLVKGKKQIEVKEIGSGDIGAITKLTNTNTGDTLCSPQKPMKLNGTDFPKPVISLAIKPKAKGDEEKISSGIHRLIDEDPTVKIENNTETHQMLLSGIGEQHLEVIISKLKAKFGTSVDLEDPKVPYRETIRSKVKVEGKHKKQSGGHGQYGHVWIEFEPGNGESDDLVFHEKVFGGSVPKNFFPAVEKGLRDSIPHGVLAGYPVVNLKATLVDGSYHPVDSSEMAFKLAASLAYKSGLTQAKPVILEPIGLLEVTVPESYMGDIIGDINKRRGRVLGMDSIGGGFGKVSANVPMAEVFKYATDLRSMTQGRGSFNLEFQSYEEAPANVAQKVIEEAKKHSEE